MTEQELAELETHLAAGTDLPTAMAASERPRSSPVQWWLLALGLAGAAAGYWLFH